MTDEELLQRLRDNEDGFVERKPESVKDRDVKRTLVAFANSVPEDRVAILFIGVANDGEPLGVQDTDGMQKRVRKASDQCYPAIRYQSQVVKARSIDLVAVCVAASDQRPHFSGAAYVRIGSETVKASEQAYSELIASRNEKAGAISRQKGNVVTVVVRGKELGSTRRLGDKMARSTAECRIDACDAHAIALRKLPENTLLSEPLSNVRISRDTARNRMLLIVEETEG